MPTDEERSAVAARLREHAAEGVNDLEQLALDIAEAMWPESDVLNYAKAELELADLIAPEPERTCELEYISYVHRCSACGWQGVPWQVTDVTDDGSDYILGQTKPSYCPNCGARVVGG